MIHPRLPDMRLFPVSSSVITVSEDELDSSVRDSAVSLLNSSYGERNMDMQDNAGDDMRIRPFTAYSDVHPARRSVSPPRTAAMTRIEEVRRIQRIITRCTGPLMDPHPILLSSASWIPLKAHPLPDAPLQKQHSSSVAERSST